MYMAVSDQTFEPDNEPSDRDIAYYAHGLAVDAFDLTIRHVPDDPSNSHAKVELVFFQDKGNHRREVVTAVRLQLHELQQLHLLMKKKMEAFSDKRFL